MELCCYVKKTSKYNEIKKEERGIELKKYLLSLGGSTTRSLNAKTGRTVEDIIVSRIIDLERSHREEKLWIIALLSAIASILSALAAWFAVVKWPFILKILPTSHNSNWRK